MSKWIDFSIDERKAMVQGVVDTMPISENAVEKDWWVTVVLYAVFNMKISNYLLFKGGTSLSKGWNIIDRFSEDIDLALGRDFFLNEMKLPCANCTSNTQIHKLREKTQDYMFGEFTNELKEKLAELGVDAKVIPENEMTDENGETLKVAHDKDPSVIFIQYPSLYNDKAAYAIPTVKIEISVLSMDEPYEMKRISSLIGEMYTDED